MSSDIKRSVVAAVKRLGFKKAGDFLIGKVSADLVSGVAIDQTPHMLYLWTFVIPRFDNLSFLHMSLGERIAEIGSSSGINLSDIDAKLGEVSSLNSAHDLISYIDTRSIGGQYAIWCKFICYIRVGDFEKAEQAIGTVDILTSASIPRKLDEIRRARERGGWPLVRSVLDEWSKLTDSLLPNGCI